MYPTSAPSIVLVAVTLVALATNSGYCWAFSARVTTATRGRGRPCGVCMNVGRTSNTAVAATTGNDFLGEKVKLVTLCTQGSKPSLAQVQSCVKSLEQMAEDLGLGQASSSTGLLNGEWELIYSPQDMTRSSPFFWAFQRAFPDNADQIFEITDAIPSPIKDIGPALQTIEMDDARMATTGTLVSRVKVATLNGMATSIMTTRTKIVGIQGVDSLELQVETTKPEDSTIVKTLLGPLATLVGDSLPAFPSGEALERIVPGSSRVVMKTTFCDETLRISRNADEPDGVFVWTRRSFGNAVERL